MIKKPDQIQYVQKKLGWAYYDFKWLNKKEAQEANRKRDALLKAMEEKVSYSFWRNKLHTGNLSPGCKVCGQGPWSCIFINGLCTAKCFYCPQTRDIKSERPPIESGIVFNKPDVYIDYLEKWGARGVSFSGGEPLIVFKKVTLYIDKIRKRLGNKVYIWLYTNGDLVTADKLKELKNTGLDEIRFDIASRNYELQKVELATRIMDTVSIEIPAIPEDYETVKKCLSRIQDIGVKYLNLNQLNTTPSNYKEFIRRNYTFLHNEKDLSILESEITALKIIQYSIDNKINIPINYCSLTYKLRLQLKGLNLRFARFIKESFEEISEAGFIRRLVIQDSPTQVKKMVRILGKYAHKNTLWRLKDANTIFIHGSLLQYVNFANSLIINYFGTSGVKLCSASLNKRPNEVTIELLNKNENEEHKEIMLNSRQKLRMRKILCSSHKIGSSAIAIFQKLFIQKLRQNEILDYFRKNYNVRTKEQRFKIMSAIKSLEEINEYEYVAQGFKELY